MKLRIAFKVLKRDSVEIHAHDRSTVPRRLVRRANRRWQRYIRTHNYNHHLATNPSRKDLHHSFDRTRRCQPIAELKRLWHARMERLKATQSSWLTEALVREEGVNDSEALFPHAWTPGDNEQALGRLNRTPPKKENS